MADGDRTKGVVRESLKTSLKTLRDRKMKDAHEVISPVIMIKSQLFNIQGTELRVYHMKIDFRLKISAVKIG